MFLFYLLYLLLCVYESEQAQDYNPHRFRSTTVAEQSYKRIIELMRSYYEEAHSRLTYMNPIRFMYEESPYYEMGYITGEIIERYRKVLEHTQRPIRFVSMTLFDILKRVEYVQKLYFELYHLVRMIHETPRKWSGVLEFINIEKIASADVVAGLSLGKGKDELSQLTLEQLFETQRNLDDMEKRREKERKRRKKEFQKIRNLYLTSLIKDQSQSKKKYNIIWPIDYGWEIDYKW